MGDGVMVYTSSMYLRPGAVTGCVDYVQFGQDDFIPFITYRKSDKEPVQADKIRCNVSPSPTDVSPTENSWMLHPLDKVSLVYCAPDRTIPSLTTNF
jgi:hypothetical protein